MPNNWSHRWPLVVYNNICIRSAKRFILNSPCAAQVDLSHVRHRFLNAGWGAMRWADCRAAVRYIRIFHHLERGLLEQNFDAMRIATQSEPRPSFIRIPVERMQYPLKFFGLRETAAPSSNRQYPDQQLGVIFGFQWRFMVFYKDIL